MGVVYFSIIPTFEPSRYYKCWIVCFQYINELIQIGTCFTDKECARIKAGLAESQQTKDKS